MKLLKDKVSQEKSLLMSKAKEEETALSNQSSAGNPPKTETKEEDTEVSNQGQAEDPPKTEGG